MSGLPAWYNSNVKAKSFDLELYLAGFDRRLLEVPQGRRLLTKYDPLLFAYLYLRKHITDKTTKQITLSDAHLDWCRKALTWAMPNTDPLNSRYAVIAPRETGKSTWHFLILPMWAAAHGHVKYIAAFSSAYGQAQNHLKNFKREIDHGFTLLWKDYPELCSPMMKTTSKRTVSDQAGMIVQANGFTFSANGMESGSIVGAKSGDSRPDLIILDDVEPGESVYSTNEVEKRLVTVRDDIIPLGVNARIVWAGYTTMVDSLVHQMVRYAKGAEPADWITAMNFKPYYYPPVVINDDGERESIWPQRWSLEYLDDERQRNPHGYAKNYENNPIDNDGTWWRKEDIRYDKLEKYDRTVLIVDGAVTTKKTSDETGLSVVGLDVSGRRFFVREAIGVRQAGEDLRNTVLRLIEAYSVSYVMVESNQAGDLWKIVFHDMPVKLVTFTQKEKKEYRIRRLLSAYQRENGRVFHEQELPYLERQELAYPFVKHEDILDATAAAVEHLIHILVQTLNKQGNRAAIKQLSYL